MDLKNKNSWISISTILLVLVIVIGQINTQREIASSKKWVFKGVVEKVSYSDKSIPTITVNGQVYDLTYIGLKNDVPINRGDIVIKEKNSQEITIIRNHN